MSCALIMLLTQMQLQKCMTINLAQSEFIDTVLKILHILTN